MPRSLKPIPELIPINGERPMNCDFVRFFKKILKISQGIPRILRNPGKRFSVSLIFILLLSVSGCSKWGCGTRDAANEPPTLPDYSGITVKRTIVQEVKLGTGDVTVTPGKEVTLVYLGWIYDPSQIGNKGAKFAEVTPEQPLHFKVGEGKEIAGLEEGILGMKADGKRMLIIPPEKGFGSQGKDTVPPGSILMIEVMVLEIK